MEFNENSYQSPPLSGDNLQQGAPKKTGWKIFFGIVLGLSIIANLALFLTLIVVGSVMLAGSGAKGYYTEKVVEDGPGCSKIAVIKIEGIIDNELAEKITEQIENAKKDKNVKALIFRTMTPGGGVAASDRIYYQINRYKSETGNPAVAFMETIATSGGFYTSAACNKIIAEPTTITGSIGVIMGHFVLGDLFTQKLGITPVIIKSGPKKDWPTSFEPVSEEQIAYLTNKLIMPTYERFVSIVAESRKAELTTEQVRFLADGSIYNAQEALDNKLIDQIGYMPDAIELAKSLANITKAKVVEYEKPFSLEGILGAKAILHLNRNTVYELTTPQLMYLWDAGLLR